MTAIAADGSDLVLRFRSRGGRSAHALRAAQVVNSSGPQFDVSRLDHPLVVSALRQGLARPDRLGLGLEGPPDFRLVGADGEPAPGLLALGPIARGGCWELTAVPELRNQCARAGSMLAGRLTSAHV